MDGFSRESCSCEFSEGRLASEIDSLMRKQMKGSRGLNSIQTQMASVVLNFQKFLREHSVA